jgi:putative hydrolase of the HAD superfamily
VLLDAAGVIVLPNPELLAQKLARAGIAIDPTSVARAHYRAVRTLNQRSYAEALAEALGIDTGKRKKAAQAFEELNDRRRSGHILWSQPAPGAREAMEALRRRGLSVVIVTNSNGQAARNLREAGICQAGPGPGTIVTAVIDSAIVGSAKPDPGIFKAALSAAGASADEAVHVGDQPHADVDGARAAGIEPIHLDPHRACRASAHRHLRSLDGIWRHVEPGD